jgi:hypothetical protein
LGLGLDDGFVWQFLAEGFEAVELLYGPAVVAFSLGLVAQQEGEAVGLAGHAMEAVAQQVVAILGAGDFDIAVAGDGGVHEADGFAAAIEGRVEAGGEVAGFETGAAKDGVLGEELLGVDGLVDGDEVVAEAGDFLEVFKADDGEGGPGENVFAGVRCGGVGAIGGEAFWGDGAMGHRALRFER